MRDFVAPEVAGSVHGRNTSGVAATCPDCHVPQPFLAKTMHEIAAAREGWGHLRGIIDTRDEFEAQADIASRPARRADVLSTELDHAMVALISSCPIGGAGYADAYRLVGRREARERQIELVLSIGADLDRIVRHAWIGRALHLWQAPARAIGFGVLHDFLDRGFDAFRNIADARTFLQTIRQREVQLMEQLFAGGGEVVFTARPQ